jgi:glycosyltransferase involved in cell wall biosynthesis
MLNSDVLVLSSLNEGSPLVILEAMMIGLPIIAFDVGFIKEMFYDEYPLICSYEDSEDNLLAALRYFIGLEHSEKKAISENLKLHFLRNYSLETHRMELFRIFN